MNKNIVVGLIVVILVVIGGGYWLSQLKPTTVITKVIAMDPKNCTYVVDGQSVTLKNGSAESQVVPGSATNLVTEYFGNNVTADFNGDGINDDAFLLTQTSGGSGTFYYVVAGLSSINGCVGTNAILLGDRIAPQTTAFNNGEIIVNYADRKPSDPMSATPTIGVSRYFVVKNGALSEVKTYGMSQYTDSTYGFTFWYPNTLQIKSTSTQDSVSFPGGIAVETLQIGGMGGVSILVVNSQGSTITDEPKNHASPISQTQYFYDNTLNQWMVAYPEGNNGPGSGATTAADVSKTTMSGLIMLASGKRFDTTIIPLSTTQFAVISDGGGSSFTNQLASTISKVGANISPSVQVAALLSESTAYGVTK